jgi:hypothetical protein
MTVTTNIKATCNNCEFSGTLRELEVHSCYVQEMGGRCEDYPCCGHTDGDGCQTRPWHTSAYWVDNPHRMCDHESGFCDADDDDGMGDCDDDDDDEKDE